jgi:hypothetical protein
MPHSVKDLFRLAQKMADVSTKFTEAGYVPEGLMAANTAAIYTVGAELIERLENMHFGGKNDDKHKEQDSNLNSTGTKATRGTKGE